MPQRVRETSRSARDVHLTTAITEITDWLTDGARSATTPSLMLAQCCERLVAAGLPLWRVGVFVRTLHPDIFGRNFIWRPGAEVVVGSVDFEIQQAPEFLSSPLAIVFHEGLEVRCRLDDPAGERFPFFDDMRAEGVTDYIALPLSFVDGIIHASSWTTKQPGGFTDAQLNDLKCIVPPLARLIEVINLRRTASTLLNTYVGARAGERILAGQIRRGHTETMQAAIWLSDLRGFTALSDRLPPEQVVEILNLYFDCQVAAILKHGGEVLKFMGDGLLAVFPIGDDGEAQAVCSRVLEAASEARAAVAAMEFMSGDVNERFRFGVALHVGRILYGNIGGGNRLDFTCIGPAVNLAARLEKIAGRLGRTIVASSAFADICSGGWSELGEFPIAGFAKAEHVYGRMDETSKE
ncbi:adenylate/guanylate cyclase domain-containing protein [Tardiphaga sp.]|uniref:adenylate/guanylate cyclase domain-containing protein n=1 Tax=Tardiphaga sp. TaxID=1926292 RepID=UPI002637BA9B|nr:adenylate/guanylate cyclase domain-containing protein [Tardiphaga sp.]